VNTRPDIAGTSLQGYITTTRATLNAALGDPVQYANQDIQDKINFHWAIQEGRTVATVYDWKRYELGAPNMNEQIEYNIGGNCREAADLVQALVRLENLKAAAK